jgi:molybdenum cofactor cytidylyltransferase
MFCAIILAAGTSSRMGQPKLLLPFGNKTIIESVLQNVLESKADNTLVVLGANRENIEKKIKKYPVNITVNPNFSNGMLSSVICGINVLAPSVQAVVVVLGDQPSISSSTINTLIGQYQKTRKGIILPVYKGRRGHPILLDIKYKKKIKSLNQNIGLRELIHKHPEDILEVKVTNGSVLQDIDTPDDYCKELKNK